MFDWIIEADIYRLKKAARETSDPEEQRKLESIANRKERIVAAKRGAVSNSGHCELSR
jgi:hypothetical protein